jgi:hypothetical protein
MLSPAPSQVAVTFVGEGQQRGPDVFCLQSSSPAIRSYDASKVKKRRMSETLDEKNKNLVQWAR